MRAALASIAVAALVAQVSACGKPADARGAESAMLPEPPTGAAAPLPDSVLLRDEDFPILAQPVVASRDRHGRLFVADRSDRDIKVYASDGHRVGTLGGAGRIAGSEFTHLSGAEVAGDSVVAYNFQNGTLSILSPRGRLLKTTELRRPPFTIGVVDDSLLLLVSHPGMSGELLATARLDGKVLAHFYAPRLFPEQPRLRFFTELLADARDGFVFAGRFGNDTLHVFDYSGHEITARAIPASAPMQRIEDLLARNGGRQFKPDSRWFHDGMYALMRVVALDKGTVALQIARYDSHLGTDLLRTQHRDGEILVVRLNRAALELDVVTRLKPSGMLLGRDRDGALLIASRALNRRDGIVLHRRKAR